MLPSRGRPRELACLLESIAKTASDPSSLQIVLCLDEDDPGSHDIGREDLSMTRVIVPPGQSMGKMFRSLYEASLGRILMMLNDDVVFRTNGWDLAVKKAFDAFDDDLALVYGNDLDQGERVPTFPFITRRACEVMGQLVPDGYLNLHLESHLQDIFRELRELGHDRMVYLPDQVFEHCHHRIGKAAPDQTSKKKDSAFDSHLFLSLAEERKDRAHTLARAINPPATEGPEFTVIIPVGKGMQDHLNRTLQGLFSQAGFASRIEILILAHEKVRTEGFLTAFREKESITVVYGDDLETFAGAANRGAEEAKTDFLVFLGPGCSPESGWLEALVSKVKSGDDVAIVGSRMINPRNNRIHHAGIAFVNRGKKFAATHLYRGLRADFPPANRPREVQAVSGLATLVLKSRLLKIGKFRTDRDGLEMIDLCLRMKEDGGRILYAPEAVVHYHPNPGFREIGHTLSNPDALGENKIKNDLEGLLKRDTLVAPARIAKLLGKHSASTRS